MRLTDEISLLWLRAPWLVVIVGWLSVLVVTRWLQVKITRSRTGGEPGESQTDFHQRLEQLLSKRHPDLKVEFPPPYEGPVPDVVISNVRTGSSLGLELRVGFSGQHIPIALLPQVQIVRRRFRSSLPQPGDVVVITTGRIPWQVTELFDKDGIEYHQVASPEEAVERLNDRLEQL